MDMWAVAVFWFVMAITPGPNNILLTSSGLTFGLRRTVPLIVGIQLGVLTQNLAVAAGLGALFASQPWLHWVLRIAGTVYVLWLAYHSLRATEPQDQASASPVSAWAAAGFQYANPKSWVAAIASATAFVDGSDAVLLQVVVVAATAAIVGTPCNLLWAVFGVALRRWISRPVVMRTVAIVLAILLAGTAVFFWIPVN